MDEVTNESEITPETHAESTAGRLVETKEENGVKHFRFEGDDLWQEATVEVVPDEPAVEEGDNNE